MVTKVALVGWGYWGPRLARNISATPGLDLTAIAESDPRRRARAWNNGAGVTCVHDLDFALAKVDAVVIATPVWTHYELALKALRAGKHVIVAKPLAVSVREAQELADVAAAEGLVLLVDHTFVYTAAVRRLRDLYRSGDLGAALYVDSARVNLGLFQHDVDVIWDLAPHDVSILSYVLGVAPEWTWAQGADRSGSGHADTAYLTLNYPEGLLAGVHVSWLSPVKVRRLLFVGDRRSVIYDDLEPSEKLKVYDAGVTIQSAEDVHRALVEYRRGDCLIPHLDDREALAVECEHFVACIRGEEQPLSGGPEGVAVVRVLEAASASLAYGAKVVA